MTRREVIEQAIDQCIKELYSKAQPYVTWEYFKKQCLDYSELYKKWESLTEKPPLEEYCGPKPYEFYYLPGDVFKETADSYIEAYKINAHQNLLDIIDILKHYCEDPIVDTYVEDENGTGHRDYKHIDDLLTETENLLRAYCGDSECDFGAISKELVNNFEEFLDMAGSFYNWNSELNAFSMHVYLGASPCSNKQTVIDNWKKYRDKDIIIDESIYKKEED